MCNGTSLIVTVFRNHVRRAQTLSGTTKGIFRIYLASSESRLHFFKSRRQFPMNVQIIFLLTGDFVNNVLELMACDGICKCTIYFTVIYQKVSSVEVGYNQQILLFQ